MRMLITRSVSQVDLQLGYAGQSCERWQKFWAALSERSCGKFFPNLPFFNERFKSTVYETFLQIKSKIEFLPLFRLRTFSTSTLSNPVSSSSKNRDHQRDTRQRFSSLITISFEKEKKKREKREREERKDGINGEHEVAQSGRCDIWSVARFKIHTLCFRNRNSFAVLQASREGRGGGGGIQIVSNVDVYSSFGSPSMIQEQRLAVWSGFITRRYAHCLFELNWDNGP